MKTRLILSTVLVAVIIAVLGFTFDNNGSNACNHLNVVLSGTGSDNATVTAKSTSTGTVYNLPHYATNTYSACYIPLDAYYNIKACYGGYYGYYANYYYNSLDPVVYISMVSGTCMDEGSDNIKKTK